MENWAEGLREELGQPLTSLSGLDKATTGPEFEETLGALFRWQDSLPTAERFAPMMRPLNADDGVPQRVALEGIPNAHRNIRELTEGLRRSLFKEFGYKRLDPAACASAYGALFERIGDAATSELVCATTNYDRSLEIAFEELDLPHRAGFRPHGVRTPNLEPEDLGRYVPGSPAVLYLHGAVGWYLTDDGSIAVHPADAEYNRTLGRPAVLYPDPSKEIERTETAMIWREFLAALDNATHVLVIGHSLNDPYLVEALRKLAPPKTSVGVVVYPPKVTKATKEALSAVQQALPDAIGIPGEFGPSPTLDDRLLDVWRGAGARD